MWARIVLRFNNLGIGTRLIAGFLLLALVSAGVGFSGIRGMSEMNQALENANRNRLPSLQALTDLRTSLLTVQRCERSMLISTRSKDEVAQQRARETLRTFSPKAREALGRYEPMAKEEKDARIWADAQPLLERFWRDHAATMEALGAGDIEQAEKRCSASVPNTDTLNSRLRDLCDAQAETVAREEKTAQEQYRSARATMFWVIAAAVIGAVAIGQFFRRLIVRPLDATVAVLRTVAAGNLTQKSEAASGDEFGQMAVALNATVQGIRTALKQDRVSWDAVGAQLAQNADYAGQMHAVGKVQAIIEFNLDGTIVSANETFLSTLGYRLTEIQGRHHRLFVPPDYAASPEYREFWAKLNRGEYVASDFKRLAKGGKEVWIRASYNPILDATTGRPYKVVKFATDVTAAKVLEERVQADTAELRRKVGEIVRAVDALAAGDFTVTTPDLGDDDVGRMARALNQAVLSVRAALEGVRDVSEQVADASAQLSSASGELSSGAQQQASSLEETASALQEITATVKQSAENAQRAGQLASGSKEVAERGGLVVSGAVEAMGEINGSSKKIEEIITTIDEIAFQTNLLALNAAVEAARAGEQGRGFAVVASEVRNLAQRSATAAKEIKGLIGDSVQKVGTGTDLVNRSGGTLTEIVTSVNRVTDIVTEMAAASREQSAGIEQVNEAVAQMDAVTQRNASQTEEMSATALALTDQAGQLRDLVSRFKLGGSRPQAGAPRATKAAPVATPRRAVTKGLNKRPSRSGPASNGRNHELDSLGGNGFTEF
ncbi:methyl-accepting chemotaxis protein [Gemmata sp. JC673]|uniref:Methyl-accepting chemotaxis protein n=1 Tax=Gemmata algarum TaxID=2975278 RepID=A0ABU5F616_9BACT|nr:methyl-accepting chemotaxis protein [Gemmata algarum]MDY3562185.1 methyl-accepting chemotaxis protein [Gemmata algarum]